MGQRKVILVALAVFASALALRLVNCNRGMWGDELTSSWIARRAPAQIVEERLAHSHLPTYFLLLHVWANAVGASKFALRLTSIVPGALAVAAFFLICARRFPAGVSILAATLLALNGTHLFVSQSCRMYGLTVLFEVLFFGCLLADLRQRSWKHYIAYATVAVAGCSLHLLFLLMAAVAAALIVWEAAAGGRPSPTAKQLARTLTRYLAPFLVGGVLMAIWANRAAMVAHGARESHALAWLNVETAPLPMGPVREATPRRRLVDPLRTVIRIPFGDTIYTSFLQDGWPKYAARGGLWIVAGGLLWATLRRARSSDLNHSGAAATDDHFLASDQRRALHLAVLWVAVPPLAILVGEMLWAWVPGPQPRWLAGAAAPWALLLACGVCRFPGPTWRRWLALLTVLALQCFFAWTWLHYPGDGQPQALAYWHAHASPGDKVFLMHRGYLEEAARLEQLPLPPEPLRAGLSVGEDAPELAQHLREFAGGSASIWLLHYFSPRKPVLEKAFALLSPDWRVERVYDCTASSVYRLTRVSKQVGRRTSVSVE
jgi:hypothetical protein